VAAVALAVGAVLQGEVDYAVLAAVLAATGSGLAVVLVHDTRRYQRLDAALGADPGS
jgi:hypothetical protein